MLIVIFLNKLDKKSSNKLLNVLFNDSYRVNGKTTFKEEFVTCGGISLHQINPNTMESKIHKGLYFCGEILDIDGVTGGFNFQSAWTTGYIAGKKQCIMNYLSVENLGKNYGERILFEGLTFGKPRRQNGFNSQ